VRRQGASARSPSGHCSARPRRVGSPDGGPGPRVRHVRDARRLALGGRGGLPGVRGRGAAGDLADDWRARYRPILAEVNEGERSWANFDELHLVTLDDLLAERRRGLPVEERRRLVEAWHRLDPWPDVPAGLEALRRRRVVATLSNGHVALLVDLARHGDLRFDCILSAELARVCKPARAAYLMAAPAAGCRGGGTHTGGCPRVGSRGRARCWLADGVRRPATGVRAWHRCPRAS
jgi:2-haloalkanoic acid dehalogenase type II